MGQPPKLMSKNFLPFFEWSKEFLKKHNKKLTITNSANIRFDGGQCAGWCDGNEMAVASNNSLFEQTYVHEFSHMNQCIEQSPIWKSEYIFWNHLSKDKIRLKSWHSIFEIIELERDCEKRSLAFSKKWNLFDNKYYAKCANLYLYYYQYTFLKRKWLSSRTIYNKMLLSEMPETLIPLDKFKIIDMDLMDTFDQCLDKSGKYYNKRVR
jgi:hypothetical protein